MNSINYTYSSYNSKLALQPGLYDVNGYTAREINWEKYQTSISSTDTTTLDYHVKNNIFVTDIYIPLLQITHRVIHHYKDISNYNAIWCKIRYVEPLLNVLQLSLIEPVTLSKNTTLYTTWSSLENTTTSLFTSH